MNEPYRKLEHMYLKGAHINTALYETITLVVATESGSLTLQVSQKYFHAAGAMHGSVYFKMLDDAAFFAVQSLVEDVFVLTTTFNLHMLRPVTAGVIRAEVLCSLSRKAFLLLNRNSIMQKGKCSRSARVSL